MTADELIEELALASPSERPVVVAEGGDAGALIGEVIGVDRYEDAIVIRVSRLGA